MASGGLGWAFQWNMVGLALLAAGLAGCGETRDSAGDVPVARESAALIAPTQVSTFVLLASGRITALDRAIVSGGNVGVTPGSGDSVSTGFDARWAQGKSTLGQRIVFNLRSAAGDLFANSVSASGSTYASLSPYASPPAQPPIVAFTAGATPVVINSPTTLPAGNYGAVSVNSVLTLSGGLYQWQSLALNNGATVQASAASVVRIAGKITGGNAVHLQPTGAQSAGNLRITVAGTGANGGITLGTDAQVKALVLSRGAVSINDRLVGSGAIAASNLSFGHDAHFTFATGFECNANAACDDGNPCTADLCADAKCVHSPVLDGTACPDDGNVCTNDRCATAVCTHPPLLNGTGCTSDGNDCTADACQNGVCAHAAVGNGTLCSDEGNPCTVDQCAAGMCGHLAAPDGTPCVGSCPTCAHDQCQGGVCTHLPVEVFVNCVAELGTGRFAALFGYESTSGAPLVVPAGPTNHIEPSSPLPDAQPPTSFDPGRHNTAFWAPLDAETGVVDWVVGGSRAHATLESPPCTATAFPSHDPSIAEPRGETHAPPAPSTPTPASYFFIQPPTPLMMTSRAASPVGASSSPGPVTLDLIPQFAPLFEVTLTYLTLGTDGCFASRDVDAELYIGGVYAGRKHVYDDGCVFCVDTCIYANPTLNVTFQMNVSPNTPTVPVRIRLLEHDSGSPDDPVMDKTFNVDNHFGQPNEVCDGGSDGWGTCFTAKQTGLPPDLVEPRVCATFKAAFMDSDLGEDDPGVTVPGATYREYPASFAFAWVGVDGPLGSSSVAVYLDADGCVPPGQIPKENFAFIPGTPPGDEGAFKMDVLFNTNNGSGGFKRPDGVHYYLTSKHFETGLYGANTHEGDVPLSTWTDWGVWKVPPARIDLHVPVLSPVTNIAAVISTMLTRSDIGFSLDDPATTGVDESAYSVEQGGQGCAFVDLFGRKYCESWGSSDVFSVGYTLPRPDAPACRQDSECSGGTLCYEADCAGLPPGVDCRTGGFDEQGLFLDFGGTDKPCTASSATCFCAQTDDSRWKFVIAHEAGHQIEERGIGHLPDAFYSFSCPPNTTCTGRRGEVVGAGDSLSDPPLVPEEAPFCSCKYVTVANSLHCLQSIERVGAAQAEGFGQFFASRAWNRQDEGDCRFGYYKEFLGHSCVVGSDCPQVDAAGQPGFINAPPVPVDCAGAVKWRNHNCPIDGRMGTEFDWMGLLYNLNSVGALRSSMQDIFNIYRQACLQLASPGSAAVPTPARCALRDQESFDVGWESEPPILDAPSSGTPCLVDADCKGTETCRDISEPGGLAPCAGTNCGCKTVQACSVDTDCVTGTSCRDDASGSPAPCTDGTCVCKLSKVCTMDADCSIYGHQHCRDDSVGFPPCADASCLCVSYPSAGFFDGVKTQFAGDDTRIESVNLLGNSFGVSRDLSP